MASALRPSRPPAPILATEQRLTKSPPPPPTSPIQSLVTTATVLSVLTAAGGITGYVTSASVPSLTAGVGIGVLYGLAAYRINQRQAYGVEMALLASLVLAGSSVPRAIRSGGRKPVPLVLGVLGVGGLLRFGNAYLNTA
ncbi:MAG: hypothetical protein M1826_002279 [Phylliscum demangeonii]|nr:MAG: hypothetical protein M1826_002279 [Phylliscum demangeonii]